MKIKRGEIEMRYEDGNEYQLCRAVWEHPIIDAMVVSSGYADGPGVTSNNSSRLDSQEVNAVVKLLEALGHEVVD